MFAQFNADISSMSSDKNASATAYCEEGVMSVDGFIYHDAFKWP